jgi:hypothetical protein
MPPPSEIRCWLREPDEGVRRGPGGTAPQERFLGFDLTIFTNGGIGIPQAPGPDSEPAHDLRRECRLPLYSDVKEPNATSFTTPSYTGRTALRVAALC